MPDSDISSVLEVQPAANESATRQPTVVRSRLVAFGTRTSGPLLSNRSMTVLGAGRRYHALTGRRLPGGEVDGGRLRCDRWI